MYNNWSKTPFFRFITGQTRGSYLVHCGFLVMQKLGRYHKPSSSRNINIINIDKIYFDPSVINCKFVKFNPSSNFLTMWYCVYLVTQKFVLGGEN